MARADAELNRARILDVAHDALAADPSASLNAIAKTAGVGPGTLYRHFPTREDLILAVYARDVDRVVAEVPDLLAEHEPVDALRVWVEHLAGHVRIKHGLGDALASPAAQRVIESSFPPVTQAIADLLAAAEAAGQVRPGLDAGDVLLLISSLWRVPEGPDGLAMADRMLILTIDGLRPVVAGNA